MKKNIFKQLAVGLSLTMLLAACGGSANKEQPVAESTEKNVTNSESANKEVEAQLPEAVKLTVELWDRSDVPSPGNATNNPLTNWVIENVKADTNIDIEFVPIPRSDATKKLNVMLTGNNAPDVVFNYSMSFPANFGTMGGLVDLAPYIDEYGPNIKKYLSEQLPYGVFDGAQYAIPAKRVNDVIKHATWIRRDLLEKYNIETPSTKEEFYNALKVIQENEPDMVPYAMATTNNERYYENFVMSYANYADDSEFKIFNTDDIRLISPGTKEGFRELNKWYNEGLISTDFVLDENTKQYEADISNANAFAFTDDLNRPVDGNWVQTAAKSNPEAYYIPITTFENHEGKYFFNRYEPIGMYIMVPKASEANAPAAIRYLDWMLEEENLYNVKTGAMLDASVISDNGLVSLKGNEELNEIGLTGSLFSDVGIVQSRYDYNDIEKFKLSDIETHSREHYDATEAVENIYKIKDLPDYFTVSRLGTPTEAEGKFGSNIRSSIKAMASKLIAASPEQFDALYEVEYQSLLDAGLAKILEERAELLNNQ